MKRTMAEKPGAEKSGAEKPGEGPEKAERLAAAPASGAEAGSAASAGGARVPKNFKYTDGPDDELHVLVTDEIKAKALEMFRMARANPKSGAGEMVRILLLNSVANMHADRYHDPKLVLGEERRRGLEAEHRGEMAQHKVEQLRIRVERDREMLKLTRLKVRELDQRVKENDRKLAQAQQTAEGAKRALENGQPLDAMTVYNRIAEIVGLRQPAEQAQAASVG